ncbi:MAG: hypothetical protein AB9903_10410 [Vulcanimicrobiota bacterium]
MEDALSFGGVTADFTGGTGGGTVRGTDGVTTGGGIAGGVSGCGGSAGGFINSPGNDAGGTNIFEEREGNDKIEGSDEAVSGIPEEMGCVKLSLMMMAD